MAKKIQIDFSLGKSCMPDQMGFTVLVWQTCRNVVWQCWLHKCSLQSNDKNRYLRGIWLSWLSLPSDVSLIIHWFVCSFLWFVQSACLTTLVEFRWTLTAAQFIDCSSQHCPHSQFIAPGVASFYAYLTFKNRKCCFFMVFTWVVLFVCIIYGVFDEFLFVMLWTVGLGKSWST